MPMSIADNLLAFTFAVTLLTLTPGLDTALVLRTATHRSLSADGSMARLGACCAPYVSKHLPRRLSRQSHY